jgi:hypothetical protein
MGNPKDLSFVGEATRRLNPGVFGLAPSPAPVTTEPANPRIRQNRGPKLNKTETAFYDHLRALYSADAVEPHAMTLVLANGCKYTPDVVVWSRDVEEPGGVAMYEVKGRHAWDDAIVKLKVAATRFPCFEFFLVSRDDERPGGWRIERVHP